MPLSARDALEGRAAALADGALVAGDVERRSVLLLPLNETQLS
jgi:hypothetical protein